MSTTSRPDSSIPLVNMARRYGLYPASTTCTRGNNLWAACNCYCVNNRIVISLVFIQTSI
jgi:hypothetical protein